MKTKHLHIVSFNVPYPPNYGGVIDVFYKLKALSNAGVKINLHCFQYGREEVEKLEDYCENVNYYPRKLSLKGLFNALPIIVSSRNHKMLLTNLLKDDHPILFEGLHTTFFINHPNLEKRKKIVRMHNVEWQYYNHLAKLEETWYKRLYFNTECKRLKQYEARLSYADRVICISEGDLAYYARSFSDKTEFIPAFHENEAVESNLGHGEYVLYHGDLSVKDNEAAAYFLIEEVFSKCDIRFIISGMNPARPLCSKVKAYPNITIKPNPGINEMRQLIADAHINLLYSFQSAGMKLKLLNALYRGRHCIANAKMTEQSQMEKLCIIKNNGPEILDALEAIMKKPFDIGEKQKRTALLNAHFSNKQNAAELLKLI